MKRSALPDADAGILISKDAVAQLVRDFGSRDFIESVQVFRAVRFLANRMNEAISAWLAPHGVTSAQYNYLAVLYLHHRAKGLSAGELGALLHATSGTVTSMTDTLVRRNLITRQQHLTDGRSVVIKLTARGERLYVEAARTHHACATTALENVPRADLKALLTLLAGAGNSLNATSSGGTDSR